MKTQGILTSNIEKLVNSFIADGIIKDSKEAEFIISNALKDYKSKVSSLSVLEGQLDISMLLCTSR